MNKKKFPQRGEIYWIELDPAKGGETQKTRPCLVVSNDVGNEVSKAVMVAPITSKVKNIYPFEVRTSVEEKPAKIMLNQCRAVDKTRILEKIGKLDAKTMQLVNEAIKIVFSIG